MFTIFKKEVDEFLNSLIAYVVIGVFLIGVGLVTWVFPESSVLDYGYATLEPLFSLGPYLFMFLIPAITMRSFAEEKRTGTMELLLTLPFKSWEVVLGKYLSCVFLVVFSILPTMVYYYSLYQLGNPIGNLDTAGIVGSYLGFLLLGCVFCSFGLFASATTENQIVAFILSAFLCFLSYDGIDAISGMFTWSSWSLIIQQFGILYHYDSMSRGLLDIKDLGYFVVVIALMLFLIQYLITTRR